MELEQKHNVKRLRGITETSVYYSEFNQFTAKVCRKMHLLRQESGLTQEQMENFEINLRQYQRIESGETKNITFANLFKIAKAFGIEPTELIDV